jgi:hypothetical protein
VKLLAIDPGNEQSAYVVIDPLGKGINHLEMFGKVPNAEMPVIVKRAIGFHGADTAVIEMIGCYGMPAGAELFETCVFIGRLMEVCRNYGLGEASIHRVKRQPVKLHLCHSPRAKDGNVRQAIIDRYGGKEKAIGNKAKPGPLYGVANDVWAALALGLYWIDTHKSAVA